MVLGHRGTWGDDGINPAAGYMIGGGGGKGALRARGGDGAGRGMTAPAWPWYNHASAVMRAAMRIEPHEQAAIVAIARDIFGPDSRVRLFGSRLDDAARGGDIDLLVEVDRSLPDRVVLAAEMEARLLLALGEQKVDVLVKDRGSAGSTVVKHAAAPRTHR